MEKNNEQLILEVARKHFVSFGYQGARMEKIADEVGVTKAMLHYYFRSKEKLFNGIVADIFQQNLVKFIEAMGKEGDFWERTEGIVEVYIKTLLENPDIPFFIMSELAQQRETFILEIKKRSAYFPKVLSFIQQMNEEMEVGRIKTMPPSQLFLTIMSMTVFPFIAKPIFCTILDFSEEQFTDLMQERKAFIMNFLKSALAP